MARKKYTWKKVDSEILLSPCVYVRFKKVGKKGFSDTSISNMQRKKIIGTIIYPQGELKINTNVSVKKIHLSDSEINNISKIFVDKESLVEIIQKNSGFITKEVDKALGLRWKK